MLPYSRMIGGAWGREGRERQRGMSSLSGSDVSDWGLSQPAVGGAEIKPLTRHQFIGSLTGGCSGTMLPPPSHHPPLLLHRLQAS